MIVLYLSYLFIEFGKRRYLRMNYLDQHKNIQLFFHILCYYNICLNIRSNYLVKYKPSGLVGWARGVGGETLMCDYFS